MHGNVSQEPEKIGFDRLLAGVGLASLDEGPIIELPMIHPLTGAVVLLHEEQQMNCCNAFSTYVLC